MTRRPKAAEIVAAELRRQIATGELKPGDKLHPENVLQTEFEISRPTLREALRMLESESLITISRGKHGGARVIAIDLGAAARQVGVYLQIEGTTLQDVWLARTIIEPPAVGLLAELRNPVAFAELEANIAAAREVAQRDPIRYADLSAGFSMLITRHCGNRTIHLLAALIHDIIRRQHKDVTARTLSKAGVDKLRQGSIRSREKALALMRRGSSAEAESFWRAHLEANARSGAGRVQGADDHRRVERAHRQAAPGQQREAARAAGCEGRLTRIGPGNCRHRRTAELAEPRPTSLRCRNLDGHLRFSRHASFTVRCSDAELLEYLARVLPERRRHPAQCGGESAISMGLLAKRSLPSVGCSLNCQNPMLSRCGSWVRSSSEFTTPIGMSPSNSVSHSALVFCASSSVTNAHTA